jgi:hypothetical protein
MRPGARHEPELREQERADRTFGIARHPDRPVQQNRRMHGARQQRLGRARHLERELEDFGAVPGGGGRGG